VTWIKLQDDLPHHPRAMKAGAEAMWLYTGGLCYCNRYLTDGFIPREAVPQLTSITRPAKAIAALLETELWEKVEGGFRILRYLKFQRSANEIEANRKQKASAGRSGGLAKAKQSAKQTPSTVLSASAQTFSSETEAELDKELETEKPKPKSLPSAKLDNLPRFEDFWRDYPKQPNGTKPELKAAKAQWDRLKPIDRAAAQTSLPNYQRHLQQNPNLSARYAVKYLKDRSFDAFAVPPLELVSSNIPEDPDEQARRLVARAGL
jgi:hypothetical protein